MRWRHRAYSTVVQLFRNRSHLIIMYFCPQTRSPYYKHTHSAQRWLINTDKTERFATALEAESPVSREISDLWNFWLHAICACTEQHSTYQIRWENWWLGLRIWCLGKCVGLGFMLELEKEKNWSLRLNPIFVTGCTYSRTVACYGYLTSNQNVLIYTTHMKKSNRQTLFLYSEKQNNWQNIIGQVFRRV